MGSENLCDIIFVHFLAAKAVYRAGSAYRIEDISLGHCTNIAEAHFLTECASTVAFFIKKTRLILDFNGQIFYNFNRNICFFDKYCKK